MRLPLLAIFLAVPALASAAPPAALLTRCQKALEPTRRAIETAGGEPLRFVEHEGTVELVRAANKTSPETRLGRCAAGSMPVRDGALPLPAGWIYVDLPGTDSRPGMILDERGGERLRYDIDGMAGTYVSKSEHARLEAYVEETVAGVSLRHARRKRELLITLGEHTNFSGKPRSAKDAQQLLAIFRALRPTPASE